MSNVAMQTVTIRLPDAVLRRARDAASALDRPLEIALAKLVAASFQGVEDAPPEMQSELARMAWLRNHDLRAISRAAMPSGSRIMKACDETCDDPTKKVMNP